MKVHIKGASKRQRKEILSFLLDFWDASDEASILHSVLVGDLVISEISEHPEDTEDIIDRLKKYCYENNLTPVEKDPSAWGCSAPLELTFQYDEFEPVIKASDLVTNFLKEFQLAGSAAWDLDDAISRGVRSREETRHNLKIVNEWRKKMCLSPIILTVNGREL